HLPSGVLTWEVGRDSAEGAHQAMRELLGRLRTGELKKAEIANVAYAAIAEAQGGSRRWIRWENFMQAAQLAGKLSAEQWRSFELASTRQVLAGSRNAKG